MNEKQKNSLIEYIVRAVKAGSSETQIKRNLEVVGWGAEQIHDAYKQALVNIGIPSPDGTLTPREVEHNIISVTKNKKSSAGEVLINLLSFILLAVVATSTGTLFYQVINKFFPDALSVASSYYSSSFSTSSIHYATAILVVAFPVYYMVMYSWFKSFRNNEKKTETNLSKFLTYVVLFVTALTILGDLIATVYTFLQGELSIRFFLKTMVIFIIAGLIFGFYYLERKKVQYKKNIRRDFFKIFGITATALVVSGIIFGFLATGSPTMERKRGFDNQREKDLAEIATCIENYASKYKKLPNSLMDLEKSNAYSHCGSKKDPLTGRIYEYNIVTPSRRVGVNTEAEFELCANFDLDSTESSNPSSRYYKNRKKWEKHSAGRSCVKSTVLLRSEGNSPLSF